MSEVFILYRNVKVTAEYTGQYHNPFWEGDTDLKSRYKITVTSIHTGRSHSEFWYRDSSYTNQLSQKEVVSAFQDILLDASYADNSWEGYCADLDLDQDSLKVRTIFDHMQEGKDKLLWVDNSFDFGADVELLDNSIAICENRIFSSSHHLWSRPSDAIIYFDGQEIEATWEEDRGHPGGPSTARMGDGWVDCEHRMPFGNEDVYWTWMWDNSQSSSDSYNIEQPKVQLIKSEPNEDDDYYATI